MTAIFMDWIDNLDDIRLRITITRRLRQAALGNFGDFKSLGDGLNELRIHYGPGYRLYWCRRERRIIVFLAGGAKSSQSKDIERARAMLAEEFEYESFSI